MVAVVASQLDPAAGIRFDLLGVGLAVGAALSQAVFVLLSRSGYRVVPADQAMTLILGMTVACSLLVAIVSGAVGTLAYPFATPSVLPLLLFTGLFAGGIPSMLFLTGIRLIGGTGAGILMLFEPVVGVALAAWLLGEGLAPIQVVGGLAILLAALILQRAAPSAERIVAAPAIEGDLLPEPAAGRLIPPTSTEPSTGTTARGVGG
jgi:drug/metabolite transporter (DMT)-like permease